MEPGPIRVRLGLMMFGQYLILGAWAVPLATYLLASPDRGGLGFSPTQTSWIYSSTAIAALLAPLMLGLLADRLFATQKLLGVLNILGAAILFVAAQYCSYQQGVIRTSADRAAEIDWTFGILMPVMLANSLVLILTLSLCNVTGFRNLREPKKSYGRIRSFGTMSWIMVNVSLDVFGETLSAQPLYVAAAASFVMGFYSFTLPHTPPSRIGKSIGDAIGLPALKMFRQRGFRVLIVSALCMAAVQQFYGVYANPFLRDLGASKPTAVQTLAQASELICLVAFPIVLVRYGFKVTLAIGVAGWVLRNLLFATGWLPLIALVGLPLHGLCFTFFFMVANVYVDRHAPLHLRASAQGINMFAGAGVGTLLGNYLSGKVLEANQVDGATSWTWFWLVPAAASAVVFILFVAFFREDDPATTKGEPTLGRAASTSPEVDHAV
jgi:nucleoside transporter